MNNDEVMELVKDTSKAKRMAKIHLEEWDEIAAQTASNKKRKNQAVKKAGERKKKEKKNKKTKVSE